MPGARTVPASLPRFVGPREAEGQARTSGGQHLSEGSIEQATPVEPVVPVDEAFDAVRRRKLRLQLARLRHPQVIEPGIGRDPRRPVTREQRARRDDVGPLREAGAPPGVVLGRGVELRRWKSNGPQRGLSPCGLLASRRLSGCSQPRRDRTPQPTVRAARTRSYKIESCSFIRRMRANVAGRRLAASIRVSPTR